jgi:apolipoprotein N-acyltransferase
MIRLTDRMAGLRPWARRCLSFGAGALAALGLPPLGLWPLVFIGFPLFLALLETGKAASWRSGFATGWLFGLGYFAVAFHWIGFAFLVEAETYLWMMPFMLGALAGGMAIYWGLAAMLAKRLGRQAGWAWRSPLPPHSAPPNGCAASSSPAFHGQPRA